MPTSISLKTGREKEFGVTELREVPDFGELKDKCTKITPGFSIPDGCFQGKGSTGVFGVKNKCISSGAV
jgi:hypothetical protein